jgi:hypothetical protein
MAQRTQLTTNRRGISVDALYEDYRTWCAESGARAASLPAFVGAFDRLRDMPELATKYERLAIGITVLD